VKAGSATITATFGGMSGSSQLTVGSGNLSQRRNRGRVGNPLLYQTLSGQFELPVGTLLNSTPGVHTLSIRIYSPSTPGCTVGTDGASLIAYATV
jgi:hypothetical protein